MAEYLAVSNLKKLGFTEHLDVNHFERIFNLPEIVSNTSNIYFSELIGRISDRYQFSFLNELLSLDRAFLNSYYQEYTAKYLDTNSHTGFYAGWERLDNDKLSKKIKQFIVSSLIHYTEKHPPKLCIAVLEYTTLFLEGDRLKNLVKERGGIHGKSFHIHGDVENSPEIYFVYDNFVVQVSENAYAELGVNISLGYKKRDSLKDLFAGASILASEFTQVFGFLDERNIYPLESFKLEFQEVANKTIRAIEKGTSKYSVLIQGESGIGKTSLCNCVAYQLASKHDFFVLYLSPTYLKQFSFDIIPYNKVCIIVNEGDTLALNRDFDTTKTTNTEEILALFDGTVTEVIEPFSKSLAKETNQLVTLITCNSTDKLDPAFLQSHRLDQIVEL